MAKNLFFSYSRANVDVVSTLAADATSLGNQTWIDHELTGGQRWWDEVLRQIRACDIFVTALSPAFVASKACEAEYAYAAAMGKPILPVMVEPGVADSLLPPELSQIQRVDYTGADKTSLSALARGLAQMPNATPLPDPLPPPPPVPATYLFDLKNEISSPDPLDVQKQRRLLDQVEEQFEAGHDPLALRELLREFRGRDDLLVRTANRIGELESRIPTVTSVGALKSAAAPAAGDGSERSAPPTDPMRMPAAPTAAELGQRATPAALTSQPERSEDDVHAGWWIAPIVFGVLGGIVAWLAVRQTNAKTARNMFIAGVIANIIWLGFAGG